jgi:uncharacterized membrane protein YphA (DoxX/SURF4 family)/peroxiredoxin
VSVAALLARLFLAGVFAVSGTAKLRDRAGATQAVRDFGLPDAAARALGPLLPVAELAIAAALLAGGAVAYGGAVAAVVLLAAFTVAIVANLARGRRPDCHCFGERSAKPLSWWSVPRNVAFAAAAVPVLAAGRTQPWALGALRHRTAPALAAGVALVVLALVVAALGAGFLALFRRYGALLLRVEDLEAVARGEDVRKVAPDFDLADLRGGRATLADLTAHGAAVLVFTSTGCGPCQALAPEIGEWAGASQAAFAVLSAGEPGEAVAKFATAEAVRVLHDDTGVFTAYGVDATPAAVVVAPDGRLLGGPAFGSEDIRALVAPYVSPEALHQIEARPLGEGDPAPSVTLAAEDGGEVDPARVAGEAVLLFWDPGCAFAQRIRDDVVAWEAERDGGAPLILVSAGEPAAVRDSGLRSRLVLDPHFAAGTAYGAPGTPSAVAVRDGRLASPVAVGGPEVIDLLRGVRERTAPKP